VPHRKSQLDKAIALFRQGKEQTAVELLLKLAQEYPRYGQLLSYLGMVLWDLGRTREAIPYLLKAAKLTPKYEDVSVALFYSLWDEGRRSEAHDELRRFTSIAESELYEEILLKEHCDYFALSVQVDLLDGIRGKSIVTVRRHIRNTLPKELESSQSHSLDGTFFFSFNDGSSLFIDSAPKHNTLVVFKDVPKYWELDETQLLDSTTDPFWHDKTGTNVEALSLIWIDGSELGLKIGLSSGKEFFIYYWQNTLAASNEIDLPNAEKVEIHPF